MIRSTINGQIIKGELVTKIDTDKIMIRFIKVGELNFIPKEGEKITYGLNINGVTLTIYEDIKISICVSRPFEGLPTRERNEYVNVVDQLLIEEEDGPDTIFYKGTLIDMFIHNAIEHCKCSKAKGADLDEDGFPYCIECQKNIFIP